VISGAGRQAMVVHDFGKLFGKPCFCLMTTDSRERWGLLPQEAQLPLYLSGEFPANKSKGALDAIIAVNPAHNTEISARLHSLGWTNITAVDDWEEVNGATREVYYSTYLRQRGAHFITDADGMRYVDCPTEYGAFKIYYDIDPIYKANLLGEFNNIALPSVFGDLSAIGVCGPYEYGEVTLRPGDTVFALGANVGLFSCVAASKGCSVHAFEPTPMTVERYLSKNASLYDNFTVVPYAVMDKSGEIPFYINEDFASSYNLTRNSTMSHLEPSYSKIEVESITLDEYVRQNGIKCVNFIKSHAEYVENFIFDGAVNILSDFSPRLSFYCRNFDDKGWEMCRMIESKILKANPKYKFLYQWRRTFAFVPETDK
jgi:FkbM family methyltransferase